MILFFVLFAIMIAIGMPIGFALGLGSVAYMLANMDLSLLFVVQKMFTGTDSFPLLAIPFFILAGNLMNYGGVTKSLLDFCSAIVGHWRGGLASVTIVGEMIFSGVSGSSVADCSALGSILIPAMQKAGYPKNYAVAINATASTIGILIPPSIPMVLLATIASTSVRDMFFSSMLSGIFVGIGLLLVNAYKAKKMNLARSERVKLNALPKLFIVGFPALMMPGIILGGIIFGIVTATEAAIIAVLYSILVGVFYYKELNLKMLYTSLVDTALQTAVVLFIIGTASILSALMAYEHLPQNLAAWCTEYLRSPTLILMFVTVLALIAGLFIDVTPALILLGAIFVPVSNAAGINIMHFGTVLVTALSIGLFTPPVGTTLILSCYIGKTTMAESFRECLPFLIVMLVILIALVFFPVLSTGLPNLMFYS